MGDYIWSIITTSSLVVFITAVAFSYRQLSNTRKASYANTAKMVFDILQTDKARTARRHVFTELSQKDFDAWSETDIHEAEIVCNTFDEVGILEKYEMLPADFVADHWNDSLQKSWDILQHLVFNYRTRMNDAYWDEMILKCWLIKL